MSTSKPVTIEDLGDGTYEASNGVIVEPHPPGASPAAWAAQHLAMLRAIRDDTEREIAALQALLLDELRGSREERFGGYTVRTKSRRNSRQDVSRFAQLLDETPLEARVLLDTIAAARGFKADAVPGEVAAILAAATTDGETATWIEIERDESTAIQRND